MKKLSFTVICAFFYTMYPMDVSVREEFIKTLIEKIIVLNPEKKSEGFIEQAQYELHSFFSVNYTQCSPKTVSQNLNILHDTYKKAYKKAIKLFTEAEIDELFKTRLSKTKQL